MPARALLFQRNLLRRELFALNKSLKRLEALFFTLLWQMARPAHFNSGIRGEKNPREVSRKCRLPITPTSYRSIWSQTGELLVLHGSGHGRYDIHMCSQTRTPAAPKLSEAAAGPARLGPSPRPEGPGRETEGPGRETEPHCPLTCLAPRVNSSMLNSWSK